MFNFSQISHFMKKINFIILFALISNLVQAQTITHVSTAVYIWPDTGPVSGDDLRAYMIANNLESVNGRDIVFSQKSLLILGGATLTDNDAHYTFYRTTANNVRFDMDGGTFNFTDGVIREIGVGKGYAHTRPFGTFNWTRVLYHISTGASRTDVWNNTPVNVFNFEDVNINISGNGYMHLYGTAASPKSMSNAKLNLSSGIAFEHFNLTNIFLPANFVNMYVDAGTNTFTKLDWKNTTWNWLRGTGVTNVIDPIKPSGWTGYSGVLHNIKEYFTHNLKVVDPSNTGIQGINVRMENTTTASEEYLTTTDASGEITEQNVLTYTGATNTSYNQFELQVFGYLYGIRSETRPFSTTGEPIDETVIIFLDKNITETNPATVAAYSTIDNLDQLYDYAKYWKTLNATNLKIPNTSDVLIFGDDNKLVLPTGWNLVVDATAASVFDVNEASKTITVKSTALLMGNTFEYVETTGTVTTANGATLEHGFEDNTGTNIFVHLKNLMGWNVEVVNNSNPASPVNFLTATNATGDFKGHYILGSATEVVMRLLSTVTGGAFYSEIIPLTPEGLHFIRSNYPVSATLANQESILYLVKKILLNEEGISQAVRGTTPNATINVTNVTTHNNASIENQETVLALLKRILMRVSASRESLKKN